MKKYWPLLVIIVILATIICMSRYADSAKHRYEETARHAKAASIAKGNDGSVSEDTYKPPVWAKFVTWPEGVGTWAVILTLLAIAWQSVETLAAAKATEASVEAGKDTAKRQLRAYVGVKGARLFIRDDGSVETRVTFINCGQTPAYDLCGVQYGRFDRRPFKKVPRPQPKDMVPASTGIVGAGQPYYFIGKSVDSGKGRELLLSDLTSPTYGFILNGFYTYKDIFEDSHQVEFQVTVGAGTPLQRDGDQTGEWLCFFNDSEGNKSD